MSQPSNQNYDGVGAHDSSTQINGNIHDDYHHNQYFYAQPDRPLRVMTVEEQARKNTALMQAVKNGRVGRVEHLLRTGADVDASNEQDISALHLACAEGATEIIDVLLNGFHADIDAVDARQITPLYMAAQAGQDASVQMLLQHQADLTGPGPSPLNVACEKGYLPVVKSLTKAGISASLARPEVSIVEKHSVPGWNSKLLAQFSDAQPLHLAAWGGHCEIVSHLLDICGAAVDSPCTMDLIDAGPTSRPQEWPSLLMESSWTPLMLTDSTPCARILLDHGADANRRGPQTGTTHAMAAAFEGDRSMVALLIERGADLSMRDNSGMTALDHARGRGIGVGVDCIDMIQKHVLDTKGRGGFRRLMGQFQGNEGSRS